MWEEMTTLTPLLAKRRTRSVKACDATGIQSVEGLVEQQNLGRTEQGCSDGEALPHALAQVVQRLVLSATKANKAEQAIDTCLVNIAHFRKLNQHVPHRHSSLPTNLFRHVTHPLSQVAHLGKGVGMEACFDFAFLEGKNTSHHAQQRRLPCTVWTNQTKDATSIEVKVETDHAGTCVCPMACTTWGREADGDAEHR